jgi:hypothetical protein
MTVQNALCCTETLNRSNFAITGRFIEAAGVPLEGYNFIKIKIYIKRNFTAVAPFIVSRIHWKSYMKIVTFCCRVLCAVFKVSVLFICS